MGTKKFGIGRFLAALRRRRRLDEASTAPPRRTMLLALPPAPSEPVAVASDANVARGQPRTSDDLYWILRRGIGASVPAKLDHFRRFFTARGVNRSEIESRVARMLPLLSALYGIDEPTVVQDLPAPRLGLHRYAIRLANGELHRLTQSSALTNQHTDGLMRGGAALVWIDDAGHERPLDVLVQHYDDSEDLSS